MIVDIEFDKAASVRSAIAVEFTDTSVRVMQLTRRGRRSTAANLRAFAEVNLPSGAVKNGVIQDPAKVSVKLMEALQAASPKKPNTPYCICLIPQRRTFLTVLDLPSVDKDELREILQRQVAEIIPMEESEVYWDWHRIQTAENKTRVQLAAVPRALIDSYMQTLEGAKLIPLLFEPSATAASRLAFPAESTQLQTMSPEPVIFLELQAEYGVISLQQQGGIVFSTDISLRSDSMAEKVIVLEQKINEIHKYSLAHLKVKPAKDEINTYVFGLPAQIDSLLPLLKERSSHPINFLEVKKENSDIIEFIKQHNDPSYFPLIGAAIRGEENYGEESTLNLIPQKAKEAFRKKELYNVLRSYLMFVAINTVFLVFMLLLVAYQIRSRVDDLQNKYESILAISNSPIVNQVETKVDLLNSRTGELNSLISGLYDWKLVLEDLNKATPSTVTLTSVIVTPNQNEASNAHTKWSVAIAGQSSNRESVISYLNNLRTSDLFQQVKLPVDSLQSQNNVTFIIEAELPFAKL